MIAVGYLAAIRTYQATQADITIAIVALGISNMVATEDVSRIVAHEGTVGGTVESHITRDEGAADKSGIAQYKSKYQKNAFFFCILLDLYYLCPTKL